MLGQLPHCCGSVYRRATETNKELNDLVDFSDASQDELMALGAVMERKTYSG